MKHEKLPGVDLRSGRTEEKSGLDWKFLAVLAAIGFTFFTLSSKLDISVEAYRAVYAENVTARSNIKALKGTPCWECHGTTGKFLPRRQYLSEQQFMMYVRNKTSRNENDRGKMPEYDATQMSEEDLKNIYIILYSTLSRG